MCKQNWPRPRRRGIPRKCRKKLSCFWGWWCNSKLLDRSGSHFFQLPIVPAFALCSCWSVGFAPNWMLNCWLPSIAEVWVIQSSHLMWYIRQTYGGLQSTCTQTKLDSYQQSTNRGHSFNFSNNMLVGLWCAPFAKKTSAIFDHFCVINLSKDQTFKAIQKALRFDQVIRFPTIKRALRALPDERPSDSHQGDMGWMLKGWFRTYWGSECSLGPLVQVTSPESQGAQHTACERCPLQKDQSNMLR